MLQSGENSSKLIRLTVPAPEKSRMRAFDTSVGVLRGLAGRVTTGNRTRTQAIPYACLRA
jgi:hypothetical protein